MVWVAGAAVYFPALLTLPSVVLCCAEAVVAGGEGPGGCFVGLTVFVYFVMVWFSGGVHIMSVLVSNVRTGCMRVGRSRRGVIERYSGQCGDPAGLGRMRR